MLGALVEFVKIPKEYLEKFEILVNARKILVLYFIAVSSVAIMDASCLSFMFSFSSCCSL